MSDDLFGNGKTALKATASRYVTFQLNQITDAVNPVTTTSNSATRAWTDLNGDGFPQGDPLNPLPNGELIGPLTNPNFGKVVVTTRYDDGVIRGRFKRPYNWEITGGVQHELRPGVAITRAYIRRWDGNFTATDNLLRTPSDYDPFCITAPLDSRLPGGGGNEFCGFDDVNPAKFSATTNNLVIFNAIRGLRRCRISRFAPDWPKQGAAGRRIQHGRIIVQQLQRILRDVGATHLPRLCRIACQQLLRDSAS